MQPDDELCLCFHVTLRKVLSYLRIERPSRASQLSDCGGAGTGCGWCRKSLRVLFEQSNHVGEMETGLPSVEEYAQSRQKYIAAGKGKPPAPRK